MLKNIGYGLTLIVLAPVVAFLWLFNLLFQGIFFMARVLLVMVLFYPLLWVLHQFSQEAYWVGLVVCFLGVGAALGWKKYVDSLGLPYPRSKYYWPMLKYVLGLGEYPIKDTSRPTS